MPAPELSGTSADRVLPHAWAVSGYQPVDVEWGWVPDPIRADALAAPRLPIPAG